MSRYRVLVIGGYGFFGRRLVERLARNPGVHVLVAGRSVDKAQALVGRLREDAHATLEAVRLDTGAPQLADALRAFAAHVVVNASGPFQGCDYRVPLACIAAGVHHIDLADDRAYVTGIPALHPAAVAAGVFVTSGASSVPALSGAAADHLARDMRTVHDIHIGISPGNRTERGLATVRSILSYCGKPLPSTPGARVIGWSGTRRHRYAEPVGMRLLSPCDVPDLALLPGRYAGAPQVRFDAGLELWFLHRGMNLMAWSVRRGWVRDWSAHAALLKRAADLFMPWGSDHGAMHVTVAGTDTSGAGVTRSWELLARNGHGPFVPTLAAAALVRKAAAGGLPPGAGPCLGWLSLSDFQREAEGLDITMEVTA